MRLLIVTPEQPRTSGNWVTACRFQAGLEQLGHPVEVLETDLDPSRLEAAVARFQPDLLLLLHAYRSGRPWLASRCQGQVPFLLLLTGTDIHQGLDLPEQRTIIQTVLKRAGGILIQNPLTLGALATRQPELAPRLHYLPPGIILGNAHYELRQAQGIPAEAVLFLHPAGVRPVKGNLELLQLFDPVAAAEPRCRVVFCGPLLDAAYAERFLLALKTRPWASYPGEIPQAAMPAALRQSDVVCNNSCHEGLPNSLLEAASIGRPMLVRNIEGNRAVVEAGSNGLCYDNPEEFVAQALALIQSPGLRPRLSRPQPERYLPEKETLRLEKFCSLALTTFQH